ncbi:MAG: beta-ketoacyl synthase chain length factor [Ferruginibacter sp.]|nr:beta-ketoacyl synthase chain length factor [Ferruginibacter sp.]
MYIRATGNISPQKTFGHPAFLTQPVEHFGNRLNAVEPDYKSFIDVKQIRRMSRIIKMGVAAAMECLQEAGVEIPGAIVTGTAYGCLEDTGIFLTKIVEQHEELLAPTAFIQSTHNTVGAQIALLLHCNGYNNVFVHRGFSFESAMLDAMLLLKEGETDNVLVGGLDEITGISHAILTRFGLYKREPVANFDLFTRSSKGTIAGEGAAFFLLASQSSLNDYAQLDGLTSFYKPADIKETENHILSFLSIQSILPAEIDLVITGRNGNVKDDRVYDSLEQSVFKHIDSVNYKQLCGEYPTSVSFALWLAANILKSGTVPAILGYSGNKGNEIKKILIYHQAQNIHHSLLLISAC